MKHVDIARELGLSRTRVQQLEASALKKLRDAFGSSATGPASLYLTDSEGVPEPAGEPEHRRGANGKTMPRCGGRFARAEYRRAG